MLLTLGGNRQLPSPPAEIADEVELWARQSGRHATLHFVPTRLRGGTVESGTWMIRISLRPTDKRLLLFQEGKVAEPPTEDVWLHEPDGKGGYRPFDIVQMGAGGVRQHLEMGDTWSGRGQFRSMNEQLITLRAANEAARAKARAQADATSRDREEDRRFKSRLQKPFLPVGIDFKDSAGHATPGLAAEPTTTEK